MTIALTRSFALTTEDGAMLRYQTIGSGEGLILVGGATLTARDYLPLARILALSHTVHVLERRGHGASSPQGPGYSIETECRDLLAFQRHTRASLVFGHGYGGLIALETARRQNVFRKITVYEPGLSIGGSMPLGWLPEYRQRLAAGNLRGAFACLVSQAGLRPWLADGATVLGAAGVSAAAPERTVLAGAGTAAARHPGRTRADRPAR